MTPAFRGDPLYRYFMCTTPQEKHQEVLKKLFRIFISQGALNGGIFMEVGDYGSCGVLLPPGTAVENPWTLPRAGVPGGIFTIGPGIFLVCVLVLFCSRRARGSQCVRQRALFEFVPAAEHVKEQVLTKEEMEKHWFVFIVGTSVDRRRQGLASALLKAMQERARADGRPLWLEATTEENVALYLKNGFKKHGEIIVGKGKVGRDGLPKKNGEGVVNWAMSWHP